VQLHPDGEHPQNHAADDSLEIFGSFIDVTAAVSCIADLDAAGRESEDTGCKPALIPHGVGQRPERPHTTSEGVCHTQILLNDRNY
jgi:hypothetical protein